MEGGDKVRERSGPAEIFTARLGLPLSSVSPRTFSLFPSWGHEFPRSLVTGAAGSIGCSFSPVPQGLAPVRKEEEGEKKGP